MKIINSTFAVHIDCDNLWVYEKEFGLISSNAYDEIYNNSLTNLLELLDIHNIKATFFVVGSELTRESCKYFVIKAISMGHAIANHSYSHHDSFGNLSSTDLYTEIITTHKLIQNLGYNPIGFRCPGYQLSVKVLKILGQLNYLYDSSSLPGPTGLLIKGYMLFKSSGSGRNKNFNEIKSFFARRKLFKYSNTEFNNLYELPLAVTKFWRLPIHSTFAFKFGKSYVLKAIDKLKKTPGHHIYLLHAIDLIDSDLNIFTSIKKNIPTLSSPKYYRFSLLNEIFSSISKHTILTESLFLNKSK